MGKVYQFSDIKRGKVPKPTDFRDAKTLALESLTRLAGNGEIYGAKVFGSVAKGTPNERSDFDLLVVTEDDEVLFKLKKIFEGIRKFTKVDIEPVVVSRHFAEIGSHSIDNLFVEHIRSIPAEGNVAGLDPVSVLKPKDTSEVKAHEEYLAQKLRRLKEGLFKHSTQERHAILQRALEAPINVGRRTLQVLPNFGFPIEMENDGKQTVMNTFQNQFKDTLFLPHFEYLLDQDMTYTIFLREALNGGVSREEYQRTVNYLFGQCVPRAIRWVSDINTLYTYGLEGRLPSKEGAYSPASKERI